MGCYHPLLKVVLIVQMRFSCVKHLKCWILAPTLKSLVVYLTPKKSDTAATNQETSDCKYLCVYVWVWYSRSARHIHETCMFPSRPVSPLLWGAPSSEAKDAFLYSHTSTKKRRYCNILSFVKLNKAKFPSVKMQDFVSCFCLKNKRPEITDRTNCSVKTKK